MSEATPCDPLPLVTVCIPTVNRIQYLEQALASVTSQTVLDWDILVGDNSGDVDYAEAVDELVARFAQRVPNSIRVLHQPSQLSAIEHFDRLFTSAPGVYVLLLADDDRMRPECLDHLTRSVRADPAVDLVFSDHWVIGTDGSVDKATTELFASAYGRKRLTSGRLSRSAAIAAALRSSMMLQAMLIRKSVLAETPLRMDRARVADFDLQLRLAMRNPPLHIVYCAQRLVEYRVHTGQFTGESSSADQRRQFHRDFLASLGSAANFPRELQPQYRRLAAEHEFALAGCHAELREWREWWGHSVAAVGTDPRFVRSYLAFVRPLIPRQSRARK